MIGHKLIYGLQYGHVENSFRKAAEETLTMRLAPACQITRNNLAYMRMRTEELPPARLQSGSDNL